MKKEKELLKSFDIRIKFLNEQLAYEELDFKTWFFYSLERDELTEKRFNMLSDLNKKYPHIDFHRR
jgi:hypothetical protein